MQIRKRTMDVHTKNIRVILADDSPEFIEGLQLLLEQHSNYQIIDIVTNGEQLVESPQLAYADIILCDIEMPLMNGIEASKRVCYKNREVLLIALSMYQDAVYLSEIVTAGFRGFIYKPDLVTELINVMERVLNKEYVFPENLTI